MNICLIGDFSQELDEGAKNVIHCINQELSKKYSIIKINEKSIFSQKFIKKIFSSEKPDIVHYFTDPTIFSLLFLKVLSFYWRGSKTIVSALHPDIPVAFRKISSFLKPDLLLVQSNRDLILFKNLSFRSAFLPNGVDTDKFRPGNPDIKNNLREKFGVKNNQFLILHVGHLKENRHLEVLEKMSDASTQILVIASEYIGVDKEICNKLIKSGVIVKIGYIQNIEEIFGIADCYIFPVEDKGAITTPLSVLEAMACNLPVVTRKFSGLEYLFKEEKGLFFANTDQEFIEKINTIKSGVISNTREMVLNYSWQNIGFQLDEIYNNVLKS